MFARNRLLLCCGLAFLVLGPLSTRSGAPTHPVVVSVVSAASYAAGPVSPGEIVVIFGAGMGSGELVRGQPDFRGRLPTTLGGVTVRVGGIAAPLLYVSEAQLSVIVPYGLDGLASTTLRLDYLGTASMPVNLAVLPAVPGLFQTEGRQVVAVNQNGTVNGPAQPAAPGDIVTLYGTGVGQTNPAGIDGLIITGLPLPAPLLPTAVRVGGLNAPILFAGAAPLLTSGMLQVNAGIPAGTGAGHPPVVLNVGGYESPPGPTLTIKSQAEADVRELTVSSPVATGGTAVSVTATLSGVAPAGGIWVALTADNPALPVPPAVFIPAGRNAAAVEFIAPLMAVPVEVRIQGRLFQSASSVTMRLNPPGAGVPITALAATSDRMGVRVSITIPQAAPAGGLSIWLSADAPGLQLPANFVIPAGAVSGVATVSYSTDATGGTVLLTARVGSITRTIPVVIRPPGWVVDSSTDVIGLVSTAQPNLVSASATSSNGILTLRARFRRGTFAPKSTVIAFSLDLDGDATTGWSGTYPTGADPGLLGADALVITGGCYGTRAGLFLYQMDTRFLVSTNSYETVEALPDGVNARLPLWRLRNATDFKFRVTSWSESGDCGFQGVSDTAPDDGLDPERGVLVASALAAPELVDPSPGAVLSGEAQTVGWKPIGGADSYVVAVDSFSGEDGWSSDRGETYLFTGVIGSPYSFNFTGAQRGRWRAWAVDQNGQAGVPSEWREFTVER